jgi:hypothetical protein
MINPNEVLTMTNQTAATQKQFFVYLHSAPEIGVFYVGKGDEARCKLIARPHNPHHTKICMKYGTDNIAVTLIPCANEQAALELETSMIIAMRKAGVELVNQTLGNVSIENEQLKRLAQRIDLMEQIITRTPTVKHIHKQKKKQQKNHPPFFISLHIKNGSSHRLNLDDLSMVRFGTENNGLGHQFFQTMGDAISHNIKVLHNRETHVEEWDGTEYGGVIWQNEIIRHIKKRENWADVGERSVLDGECFVNLSKCDSITTTPCSLDFDGEITYKMGSHELRLTLFDKDNCTISNPRYEHLERTLRGVFQDDSDRIIAKFNQLKHGY